MGKLILHSGWSQIELEFQNARIKRKFNNYNIRVLFPLVKTDYALNKLFQSNKQNCNYLPRYAAVRKHSLVAGVGEST
jgi:hypothetical protein